MPPRAKKTGAAGQDNDNIGENERYTNPIRQIKRRNKVSQSVPKESKGDKTKDLKTAKVS